MTHTNFRGITLQVHRLLLHEDSWKSRDFCNHSRAGAFPAAMRLYSAVRAKSSCGFAESPFHLAFIYIVIAVARCYWRSDIRWAKRKFRAKLTCLVTYWSYCLDFKSMGLAFVPLLAKNQKYERNEINGHRVDEQSNREVKRFRCTVMRCGFIRARKLCKCMFNIAWLVVYVSGV
jgi:hypothetical protein